jgi:raffinose/stachyose/melibiose transport system substrate-binding protein
MRSIKIRQASSSPRARFAAIALATVMLVLGLGASGARPAGSGQVTISLLEMANNKPGYDVLIANFERVYPNITIDVSYAPSATYPQLITTEFAAGSAPDLLFVNAGCGTAISVCVLGRAGDLAPMVKEPWTKRSLPLVTSMSKVGPVLFGFEPVLQPVGMFTNDTLFAKLGLKVPQTFRQLLDVCQQAKAAGTVAMLLAGANLSAMHAVVMSLAVATVYGKDPHFNAELKAGTVSFDGSPGWHQALQEFVDMNNAGCFQPGATGTMDEEPEFAAGQGLMLAGSNSGNKGDIDTYSPQFSYSMHPYPGGTSPDQTVAFVHPAGLLSINAHSTTQNQAAAQTFVDFLARTGQDALYAQVTGALTPYEFLKGQLPAFLSSFAPAFAKHEYVIQPDFYWWNANVRLTLDQDAVGLLTGQTTIDQVLQAMDAAWKQGPA